MKTIAISACSNSTGSDLRLRIGSEIALDATKAPQIAQNIDNCIIFIFSLL